MKSTRMWMGLLATLGMGVGVIIALAGLPYGWLNDTASAAPPVSVLVSLDCDTATAGIQSSCNIPNPASGTRTVAVIATNNTGAATTIGAFNFDLYNPACGGTGAPTHPQGNLAVSGCTISALPNGIWPNSIPNILGASSGFTNLVRPGWVASCATGGDFGDAATGSAGTSTSFLSCFSPAGDVLAAGASVILGTQTFTMDVVSPTSIPLTLSNVSVVAISSTTLAACDPANPPPAPPTTGTGVSGPCFSAVLNFTGGPTATPTPTIGTPLPTNTPTPIPTATQTNTPPPTPTPTSTPLPTNTPTPIPTATPAVSKGVVHSLSGTSGRMTFGPQFELGGSVRFERPLETADYIVLLTPENRSCTAVVTARSRAGLSFSCPGMNGAVDWLVVVKSDEASSGGNE